MASLAQCHRGVLHDGRVVAVKIQHPDVRRNAYTDMSVIDVRRDPLVSLLTISLPPSLPPSVAGVLCLLRLPRLPLPVAGSRGAN